MMETPIEKRIRELRLQGKHPHRPGRYTLAGSARRYGEKQLSQLVQDLFSELERILPNPPERTDAAPSPLRSVRELVRPLTDRFARMASGRVGRILDEAEREERATSARQLSSLGIDVLGGEPWLKRELETRSKSFTGLIRDVGNSLPKRIGELALEALEKGWSRPKLKQKLKLEAGVADRKIRLIARDQVGKLQGALHESRQRDVGITSFVWRTSRDERVAGNPSGLYPDAKSNSPTHGNHWEREGRRFRWTPSDGGRLIEILPNGKEQVTVFRDGIPGHGIQCRCFAEPFIEGLEDLQELDRPSKEARRYRV